MVHKMWTNHFVNKLLNFTNPLTNAGMWNTIYNRGDYFEISADKNTISQKHPNNSIIDSTLFRAATAGMCPPPQESSSAVHGVRQER